MQLGSYQQWQRYFGALRRGEAAEKPEILPLRLSEASERAFRAELEETVSALLTRAGGRFSRALRETSEYGALEEIPLLARRYRREVRSVFFIRDLSFLGAAYRQELEQNVRRELDRSWKTFLRDLRRQAEQTPSPGLEELITALQGFRLLDE